MRPRRWRRGPSPEVERLARARGLVPVPPDGEVPRSLRVWERSRCGEVFATPGHPEVVVGNRSFVVPTEAEPARMGFIAVRHGAALPHVLIRGGWTDGAGTLAATNFVMNALGNINAPNTDIRSAAGSFADRSERLEGVEPATYTDKGSEQDAWRLLDAAALARLAALAESFEIEIDTDWVVVHRLGSHLATDDEQMWDWVCSAASRLVDLARVWQGAWPPAPGAGPPVPWDPAELPLYTPAWVERPVQADGVISRRYLGEVRERAEDRIKDEARELAEEARQRGAAALGRLRRRGSDDDEA